MGGSPASEAPPPDSKVFRIYLFIFRERGMEGEREGEKHESIICLPRTAAGDLAHKTQACDMTGNGHRDILVCRLIHTSQGNSDI